MDKKFSYRDIPGYCNFHDLYKLVLETYPDDSHFVEVGAWLGHSSAYMGELIKASEKKIRFDVIDIWEIGDWSDEPHVEIEKNLEKNLRDTFIENMNKCGVLKYINALQGFSKDLAPLYKDRSLDFVFIDACHSYDSVVEDINLWYPKVKVGGILAGDDYNWEEVRKAVKDTVREKNYNTQGNSWIHLRKTGKELKFI